MLRICESMDYVFRRYLQMGMSVEEVAEKTQLPISQIEENNRKW